MMDRGRQQITVLSTLRDGLFRNVRNSERRHWTYVVERAPPRQDEKRRVVAAAEEASVHWLRSEFEHPDSMLCVQEVTPGQQSEIGNLLLDLPYDFSMVTPPTLKRVALWLPNRSAFQGALVTIVYKPRKSQVPDKKHPM